MRAVMVEILAERQRRQQANSFLGTRHDSERRRRLSADGRSVGADAIDKINSKRTLLEFLRSLLRKLLPTN
jgi:hypothetical protein